MDDQQTHEKMCNITNHQGNASQNHSEILLHTCQNGYCQKDKTCSRTGKEQDIMVREKRGKKGLVSDEV